MKYGLLIIMLITTFASMNAMNSEAAVEKNRQRLALIFDMPIPYPFQRDLFRVSGELNRYTDEQVRSMSDDQICLYMPHVWIVREVSKSINNGKLSLKKINELYSNPHKGKK